MSLINIQKRTTSNVEDFEKFISSDNSFVFTDASKIEEWAIELTIGDYYSPMAGKEPLTMFRIKDEVCIDSQSSLVIEVNEELRIPNNIYGLIVPKGTLLLEHGILMAPSKIESRYNGRLRILLYNTTQKKKYLKKADTIASSIYFRTETTLFGQSSKTRPNPTRTEESRISKVRRFFKTDYKFLIPVIISLGALILTIIKALKP